MSARRAGYFDADEDLRRLSGFGDRLDAYARSAGFEFFRSALQATLTYADAAERGRTSFDPTTMLEILVIQAQNNVGPGYGYRPPMVPTNRVPRRKRWHSMKTVNGKRDGALPCAHPSRGMEAEGFTANPAQSMEAKGPLHVPLDRHFLFQLIDEYALILLPGEDRLDDVGREQLQPGNAADIARAQPLGGGDLGERDVEPSI